MLSDNKYKYLILSLLIIFAVNFLLAYSLYTKNKNLESELGRQKAETNVLSEEYAKNLNVLQNELKISKQNAEMLANSIQKVQAGEKQAVEYLIVQSPTVEKAAIEVADKIEKNDSTMPPAALSKTDETLVVPQEVVQKDGSKEWQVGVYKVNNYRNWEWSAGVGIHGGDKYIPVELQRNFDKNQAVSYEHHFAGKESGWELKYTVKTDKLMFVF